MKIDGNLTDERVKNTIRASLGGMLVTKAPDYNGKITHCTLGQLIAEEILTATEDRSAILARVREAQRAGNTEAAKKMKKMLPVAMFQCRGYKNNLCSNENAEPNGLCVHDFDHVVDDFDPTRVREYYEEHLREKVEATSEFKTLFFYITASGDGFGAVTLMRESVNDIDEEQEAYARYLGMKRDPAVKDLARRRFLPAADDILFVNTSVSPSPVTPKRSAAIYKACNGKEKETRQRKGDTPTPRHLTEVTEETFINGIGSRGLLAAAAAYREKEWPAAVGSRHTTLLETAPLLARLCNNAEELRALLLTCVEPDFDAKEIDGIADTAIGNGEVGHLYAFDPITKAPLYTVPKKLSKLLRKTSLPTVKTPENLPRICQLVQKLSPADYRKEALVAMLPLLSAIGTGVRVNIKGLDGFSEYSTTTLAVLVGPPSSGKSTLKNVLTKALWKKYSDEQRLLFKKAENEKEARIDTGENSPKPKRNRYKIQELGDNTTLPSLAQRLEDLDGMHALILSDEIAALKIIDSARHVDHETFLKMFQDEELHYTRQTTRSFNVTARANILACGTPESYIRWMGDTGKGMHSRVITIPLTVKSPLYEAPVPEELTTAEREELAQLLDRLRNTKATIPLDDVANRIEEWKKQIKRTGMMVAPQLTPQIIHRIGIMAMRGAALMAAITEESEQVANYAIFLADYVFYTNVSFWGDLFEQTAQNANRFTGTSITRNTQERWFDNYSSVLPPTFGMSEAIKIIQAEIARRGDTERTGEAIKTVIRRYCVHNEHSQTYSVS